MTRYVAIPARASHDWDDPLLPQLQVDSAPPRDTQLYDADGRKLSALPDEIGFIRPTAIRKCTERP